MSSLLFKRFSFFLLFFFITFNFLGVLLEVEFFVISRILILLLFFYLFQIPCRYPGSCVLYHFSDAQSLSCFALSPSCSLAFSWKLRSLSILGCSIFLLFFYLLHVPCVLLEVAFFVIFRILKLSPFFLYLLHAFSCNLRSMSLSAFSFALLFFFISFIFVGVFLEVAFLVISRIFFLPPVFLYLHHVPRRSPGSCVLCHFSDSHSLSCFSLSASCSLAFSWNLRSLSFLGFPVALQFLFISHMFNGILLEVGFFFF